MSESKYSPNILSKNEECSVTHVYNYYSINVYIRTFFAACIHWEYTADVLVKKHETAGKVISFKIDMFDCIL